MADEFEGSEKLLEEYMSESPSPTPTQLAEMSRVFGLPVSEIRNIARGMRKARTMVTNEVDDGEVLDA